MDTPNQSAQADNNSRRVACPRCRFTPSVNCPLCKGSKEGVRADENAMYQIGQMKRQDMASGPYLTPTIVCLCGSTRFPDAWKEHYRKESLEGKIVLSLSVLIQDGESPIMDGALKAKLDGLHLKRIELADEVLILNVGGYMGDSTRREMAYALGLGKTIRWIEAL